MLGIGLLRDRAPESIGFAAWCGARQEDAGSLGVVAMGLTRAAFSASGSASVHCCCLRGPGGEGQGQVVAVTALAPFLHPCAWSGSQMCMCWRGLLCQVLSGRCDVTAHPFVVFWAACLERSAPLCFGSMAGAQRGAAVRPVVWQAGSPIRQACKMYWLAGRACSVSMAIWRPGGWAVLGGLQRLRPYRLGECGHCATR